MELALIIFWVIISFAICMIRCYGLLNEQDILAGKTRIEKRNNLLFLFSKIWFSTLPVLFFFWIFFYQLNELLLLFGIKLTEYKIIKSLVILFAGIPVILFSGYLGNRLWLLIFRKFLSEDKISKFSFWDTETEL
jgi:hypothetical protein